MTRAGSTGSLGSLGSFGAGVDSAGAGAGSAGLRAGRGGGGPGVASGGVASAVGGAGGVSLESSDNEPSPNAAPRATISRNRHFRTRRITAPIVFDYTPATVHGH